MKKIIALFMAATLFVAGCSIKEKQETKKLQVYASFDVIKDLTMKVTQDVADVHLIVESGEEPHDFELSTKQLATLTKADVIVYNGLGMEPWIEKVKENAKNVNFVDTSEGIKVIEGGHNHDHDEKHDDHDHEHNPHIWTSIKNAQKQLTTIKNQLVKIDEKNAKKYEENYQKAFNDLEALEKEYATQLKDVKRKTVVVSHAAYTYLLQDYGLEEHAVSDISPNVEPNLAKLAELVKLIKEEGVTTVFFDESVAENVSKVLAKEANVRTDVLYTLEKYPQNEDYISLMKKNLVNLKRALDE